MKIKLSFIFFFLAAVTSGYAQKYHDAAAFGLKGPVKSYKISERYIGPFNRNEASFDQDGKFQIPEAQDTTKMISKVERDKNGYLLSYEIYEDKEMWLFIPIYTRYITKHVFEYNQTTHHVIKQKRITSTIDLVSGKKSKEKTDFYNTLSYENNYSLIKSTQGSEHNTQDYTYYWQVLSTDKYGNPKTMKCTLEDGKTSYEVEYDITYWSNQGGTATNPSKPATTTVKPSSTNTTAVKPSTTSTTNVKPTTTTPTTVKPTTVAPATTENKAMTLQQMITCPAGVLSSDYIGKDHETVQSQLSAINSQWNLFNDISGKLHINNYDMTYGGKGMDVYCCFLYKHNQGFLTECVYTFYFKKETDAFIFYNRIADKMKADGAIIDKEKSEKHFHETLLTCYDQSVRLAQYKGSTNYKYQVRLIVSY